MRRRSTLGGKIWAKIEKGGEDDCWLWRGRVNQQGYGEHLVRVSGSRSKYHRVRPHRAVYELTVGPIPDGELVRHKCNNTLCCNPAHLMVGDHQDNMDDMVKSGRSLSGGRNPRAKLTDEDVESIRKLRREGRTLKEIAEQFPVSLSMVGLICQRKAWRGCSTEG